jgi:threonine synthase
MEAPSCCRHYEWQAGPGVSPQVSGSQDFVKLKRMASITYLECTKCGEHLSGDKPQTLCPRDGGSLYVRYDLASLKGKFTPDTLRGRPANMWRYREVLPGDEPVTLGEGFTPMLAAATIPTYI